MRYLIALLIAVIFVGCQNSPQYPYYPYEPPRPHERPYERPYEWDYREVEREFVIGEHNNIRVRKHLGTVRADSGLTRAAQEQAEWMARIQTLTHRDAAGAVVSDRVSRQWRHVGENIAFGYDNVRDAIEAWMRSPDHHRNIVGPHYTHIGVGMAEDVNGVRYWCVIFGG